MTYKVKVGDKVRFVTRDGEHFEAIMTVDYKLHIRSFPHVLYIEPNYANLVTLTMVSPDDAA